MQRIVIIGGGASGLVAAIYAKKEDNEVMILERNSSCGKKLLITGNGRCNYWNEDQSLSHYHSENRKYLPEIITRENQIEIMKFFNSLGIIPKIKNGYYYPFSNQANSIQKALLLEVQKRNITIKTNQLVTEIKKEKNKFYLTTSSNTLWADKVIIATGSKAAPKTGSDGIGYSLAQQCHHTMIKVLPALVQLRTHTPYLKTWAGVRADVKLSLEENDHLIQEETGEIQLTNYGISGICTFNLSYYVAKGLAQGKKEIIKINFLPFLTLTEEKEVIMWLETQNQRVKNRNIQQLLEGILNYKLVEIILKKSRVENNLHWTELSQGQKENLVTNLIAFAIEITSTNSYDSAQVCSGGIPLTEIDRKTMESKKESGLYLTGEILDVTGDCGGYNLSFAWITGMLAGKSAKKE